jgi:hypothetical protein
MGEWPLSAFDEAAEFKLRPRWAQSGNRWCRKKLSEYLPRKILGKVTLCITLPGHADAFRADGEKFPRYFVSAGITPSVATRARIGFAKFPCLKKNS